jgi:hypothetical protein
VFKNARRNVGIVVILSYHLWHTQHAQREMSFQQDLDLPVILEFAVALARKAGVVILEGSHALQNIGVGEKTNSVDLVTQYDVRVEELVKEEIANVYPTFKL